MRAIITLISPLLMGMFTLLTGQGDPDPARFAKSPDGDEVYIESFEYWDEKNSVPDDAVLFVGSSSIRKWPTSRYFPFVPVINRGFGGSHISDVNYYLDKTVLKYAPRAIVLYAGDNDIASGKSALRVFEDYKSFVARVNEKLPDTPIIFIPIKPSLRRWSFWPVMEKTNTLIKTYAKKYPALYYADTATPMLNAAGQPNPALFMSDSLHLSQHGYDLWSARLEPVLKQALQAVK